MIRVGIAGTGYAAKLRAEALQAEPRAQLVAIAGNSPERTHAFSETYNAAACASWQALIERDDLDLVIIATVNRSHGAIAQAALQAGKHVVVEYPLALDVAEAEAAIALAQSHNKLLHVEHIELLGGVHQALKAALPKIGTPFFAQYITLKPERPAPKRWTYDLEQFGFPLVGALSRLHRLVDLFGAIDSVGCQAQFWQNTDTADGRDSQQLNIQQSTVNIELAAEGKEKAAGSGQRAEGKEEQAGELANLFSTCLCTAHLRFATGLLGEVTYGKGEALWQAARHCEVQGALGAILFEGDRGTLIQPEGSTPIEVGGRRGLFAKDTAMVLDHLLDGHPLYVSPAASLYTLRVADAARRSAETGHAIFINSLQSPKAAPKLR
jgi:biliverdin reductase